MSDLDQAVHAEIDAWAPRAAPPAFDALAGRKRARDRRRLAAGGAALSAVAIAGAAVLAPSLAGGGPDRLPTVGSSPAPTAPASGEDLDALVERCLKGWTAVPVPGYVGMTKDEAFPPFADYTGRPLATDGACSDWRLVADEFPYLVLEDDRVVWAGRLTAPPEGSTDAVPVPPQDPADAEVCKDTGSGSQCYSVGPDQAQRLAAALATGRPLQPGDAECVATPVAFYRARFMPAAGVIDPLVWEIPSGLCLPMTAGGTKYDLPDDAQTDVVRIWDTAALVG